MMMMMIELVPLTEMQSTEWRKTTVGILIPNTEWMQKKPTIFNLASWVVRNKLWEWVNERTCKIFFVNPAKKRKKIAFPFFNLAQGEVHFDYTLWTETWSIIRFPWLHSGCFHEMKWGFGSHLGSHERIRLSTERERERDRWTHVTRISHSLSLLNPR